jgi:WD40 repeat protein
VFGVDGQQRMEWKALHSSFVWDVDWAHADRCVSASNDNTCKVWDPQTGELAGVRRRCFAECDKGVSCGRSTRGWKLLLHLLLTSARWLLQEPC